jgi:aryl-alcohol dehydrogenase-like predicted oxidoreductase
MQSRIRFEPSRITLGSVQLGIRYGIANTSGQPTEAEAFRILDRAVELGISTIDTARNYGAAEKLIRKWLVNRKPAGVRVVTKVPKIPTGSNAERKQFVRGQIAASQAALGIEPLALVLTHEETDLLDPAVVEEFQSALAGGLIEGFGASVYDVAVAEQIIATTPIAALQVPANIADRRFEQAGVFSAASALGIAVFVRSVFLQGILLMTPERLPDHLQAFAPLLVALADAALQSGRSVSELLITSIHEVAGVTSLVLGVDTASQLEPHSRALLAPPLPSAIREDLIQCADRIPPELLVPTNWQRLANAR